MFRFKNKLIFQLTSLSLIPAFISILVCCKKLEPERVVKIAIDSATNVSYTSCSAHGTIIDIGSSAFSQHGFCWSVTPNPTTQDSTRYLGPITSATSFSSILTGLSAGRTYYIRAFVQNTEDTFYGSQKSIKTDAYERPVVSTTTITKITHFSAQGGGVVSHDGGSVVTARGVCWSILPNPTISNDTTLNGSGTGSFTSNLEGLLGDTTYYVKAYASNAIGTGYGSEKKFRTLAGKATLTTSEVTKITADSAVSGGNIIHIGGASISQRGVCWNSTGDPTLESNDGITKNGTGAGTFTSTITGLTEGTTYYVKAYATNIIGTSYGDEKIFKATWCGNNSITDYDGNEYQTVKIGNQCWMRENLQVTHYSDGTSIPFLELRSDWDTLSYTGKAFCYYNNSITNRDTYGALYTWAGAMNGASSSDANPSGVQGVCPVGWHLPSDSEWTQLTDYLGGESIACGIMKETGTSLWNSPNTEATNSSGFTALPGGYSSYNGYFYHMGINAFFWSSTGNINRACHRVLGYSSSEVTSDCSGTKSRGFSVRCLKDE